MSNTAETPFRALVGTVNGKAFNITADAILEETGTDELVLTEHPVEQGASVTDHAYKRPARVALRIAFSRSTPGQSKQGSASSSGTGLQLSYLSSVYGILLSIQAGRTPFKIYTGKRVYSNMLIQALSQTTDRQSENALFCNVVCQELLIASTSTFTVSADQTVLSNPAANAPTVSTGQKQVTPTSLFNGQAVGLPNVGRQIGP